MRTFAIRFRYLLMNAVAQKYVDYYVIPLFSIHYYYIMIRNLDYKITQEADSILSFLKEHGYSSNLIVHLKKTPESILKNGVWSYVNEPLHAGDLLSIRIEENEGSGNIVPNEIPLSILYEDEDILVIDKPANMPIHPSMNHYEQTLANGVLWYYTSQQISYTFRCITRLDRDTTGVTLLAKHMLSASVLSKAMQQKQIQKEYLALCDGVTPTQGTINAPICRTADSVIERCVDFENGDSAITQFIREWTNGQFSLVRVKPETGRTHQIRVHLKHIGHPLLGDFLYHPENHSMNRQALHCTSLTFTHPITGKKMTVNAKLPEDMQQLLSQS